MIVTIRLETEKNWKVDCARAVTAGLVSGGALAWVWIWLGPGSLGMRGLRGGAEIGLKISLAFLAISLLRLGRQLSSRWARVSWFFWTLGLVTLALTKTTPDLHHLAERLAYFDVEALAATLALLLCLPLVATLLALRKALQLIPRGFWVRVFVASAGAAAGQLFSTFALKGDYFGVHLLLQLGVDAAVLLTLRGGRAPSRRLVWALPLAGLSLLALIPAVQGGLVRRTNSPMWHFLDPLLAGSAPEAELPSDATGPYFTARDKAPKVPATQMEREPDAIVILITVDALRADLVAGKYDHKLPTLARLRQRAIWFSEARSAGALTKVSLSTLFQGRHFSSQYWTLDGQKPVAKKDTTPRFPEFLKAEGIETINIRGISWLRNENFVGGFSRDIMGKSRHYYTPSAHLIPHIEKELLRTKRPRVFLYSHWPDPHAPYDLGGRKGSSFERYLGEVAEVDKSLSKLLSFLDQQGRAARTFLILSADHGEAFGEHQSQTHGTTLYEEGLHVPLLLVPPEGTAESRQVSEPVSLIDLGPTVLDWFGLETPGFHMGQSLVPFVHGETPRLSRPVVAEARELRALWSRDGMKTIWNVESGRFELYDLKKDPKEELDLASDREKLGPHAARIRAFFGAHELKKRGYRRLVVR